MGLRVSERLLLLRFADSFLLCASLIVSVALRTDLLPDFSAVLLNIKWLVTLVAVWALMASVFDIYNLARAADPNYGLWSVIGAVSVTSVLYVLIPWLTPPLVNRTQPFLFFALAVISVSVWRLIYTQLFIQPVFQRRALVVGAGQSGQALVKALGRQGSNQQANPYSGTGHELIGFVDDNPNLLGVMVDGVPVLGDSSQLLHLVDDLQIDEIVVAITDTQSIHAELFEAILDCREMGIPIVTMTTIYERLTGRVAFQHASRNVETAAGQNSGSLFRFYGFTKRVVDIVGASIGLIILALIAPLVAVANLIWSRGPLFFRQCRVGKGGYRIDIIKFRSMVPDAEQQSGAVWALEADERVTLVGKWLRLTHIDELPQVINVLKGEMSLVGPRPERPEFVDHLSQVISFYRVRHSVKPGITGWAQIHQDYGDSVEMAREKLEYDLYYLKHIGPMIDTLTILRTMSKVLSFKGR